ncbi:MAG: epoxyqueuosine reductase QueH [Anaerovoracaceae bacterium]
MDERRDGKPGGCDVDSMPKMNGEWVRMDGPDKKVARPSVLLHSCCGPCSTACVERLVPDYEVTVYFYNPNITDEEEYEKRKEAQLLFIEKFNEDPLNPYTVGFKEGPYDKRHFYEVCRGLEKEPEGGRRCQECFDLRLKKTAEEASMLGYDCFTTTLTVSSHKDYSVISRIGKRASGIYGVDFLDIDFKKKAGFQRSVELSKKYGLYRQDYCGCEFANYHLKNQEDK